MYFNYVGAAYLKNERQHKSHKAKGFFTFVSKTVVQDLPRHATHSSGRTRSYSMASIAWESHESSTSVPMVSLEIQMPCVVDKLLAILNILLRTWNLSVKHFVSDFKNLILNPVMLLSLFGSYSLDMLILKAS